MGKPTNKHSLGTVTHDRILTVWQWANRKHFPSVHSNIWNSIVAFYNKTTCLLRHQCFNRDLSVLLIITSVYYYKLLFINISPWNYIAGRKCLSTSPPTIFYSPCSLTIFYSPCSLLICNKTLLIVENILCIHGYKNETKIWPFCWC